MATEKRLIDADAFIEHYCEDCGQCCDLDVICCQTVTDLLDFPTVDAVEVVRCKNCKWYNPEFEVCEFWHGARHPEHFCGEGERK